MAMRFPEVILGTAVVPWDEDHAFIERLFREQVRRLATDLTPHLYIFGTAGEGYAVTESQFDQVARAFVDEMRQVVGPDAQPMVGLISLSLGTVLERIERCRDLGVTHFQISLPAWGACTDGEVDRFFAQTCGRYPDCRFLHYNLPRTQRMLAGADYARLAAAHPNLVAVKTGGADRAALVDMLEGAPDLRFFFTELNFASVRDAYECGLLISMASTHPARAQAFFASRGEALLRYRDELKTLADALLGTFRPACHIDAAFDKAFVKLHQPDFPLRILPPYEGPTDAMFDAFVAAMPASWRHRG